jgi:hypothetical protein
MVLNQSPSVIYGEFNIVKVLTLWFRSSPMPRNTAVNGPLRRQRLKLARSQKCTIALGFLILVLGLGNLVRAAMAVRYSAVLPNLPIGVSWTYLAAMGGFWGMLFVACAVGLVRFHPRGRRGTLVAVTLYEAHVWGNHLLFDANDYAHQIWPRDLALTLLLLILVWGLLNWPDIRREFRR